MNEKLDGCRAVLAGHQFWTRAGNVIAAPEWFTDGLPTDQALDGELWAGRGAQTQRGALYAPRWILKPPRSLGRASVRHSCAHADVVEHQACNGGRHLMDTLTRIQSAGGEGLVIRRNIGTGYATGRQRDALKVKTVPLVFSLLKLCGSRDRYYARGVRAAV